MPPMTLHVKGREMIGYQGPRPRKGEQIELHYRTGETVLVEVERIMLRTNGPIDSHHTRVTLTSIFAREARS